MKVEIKELKEDVQDEERAIEEVLRKLREIKDQYASGKRDITVEPAMGTYLMNFYNGIENILKRISRVYFATFPSGESWHKELLQLSIKPPVGKIAVFNNEIIERLHIYRNFRHRFVSGYGFELKGEKMLDLIDDAEPLWNDIKKELTNFWKKI